MAITVDSSFRNIGLEDFTICFRGALRDGKRMPNESIYEAHGMYVRSNGNTLGCPSRELRKEIGIYSCAQKCLTCWNKCLNHIFDRESLGGFWNV
ncbi:MAG: hypothetical protein ACRCX2_24030 [Paraclostridium sp.]